MTIFHARETDPETSHQAAASINHFGLKPAESAIIQILTNWECNDDELYERYLDLVSLGMAPMYTPQALRTIRKHMWDKELVHVVRVAKNKSGRNARIWKASI